MAEQRIDSGEGAAYITREELGSLRSLKREIAELRSHMIDVREGGCGCIGQAADSYKRMLEDRVGTLCGIYERLLFEIDRIPDSRVRRVIMMHYVYGWSWQKVAFQIDATSESTPRLLLSRWLSSIENAVKV